MFTTAASVLGLAALAAAQFPPTPEGVKVLKSKIHDGVKITYKEVSSIDRILTLRQLLTVVLARYL